MRGKSTGYDLEKLFSFADTIRKAGFGRTEPFVTYGSNFSHFIDLGNYSDNSMATTRNANADKSGKAIENVASLSSIYFSDLTFPQTISQCSNARLYIFLNDLSYKGYTLPNSSNIFIGPGKFESNSDTGQTSRLVQAVMHEIGHAFAGLADEYVLSMNITATDALLNGFFDKNCALDPADNYSYKNKLYGNLNIEGCSMQKLGDLKSVYRPTTQSLMNELALNAGGKFNTVSCGYVIAAITGENTDVNSLTGENGKQYFERCKTMSGLADSGINYGPSDTKTSAVLPHNIAETGYLLSSIGDLIDEIFNTEDDLEPITKNSSRYLAIDSFDPNNTWGALIELDKNGQMTRPIVTGQTTIATPIPEPAQPKNSIIKNTFMKTNLGRFISTITSGAQSTYSDVITTVSGIIYRPTISPKNSSSPAPTPIPSTASDSFLKSSSSPTPTVTSSPKSTSTPVPSNSNTPTPTPKITPSPTPSNSLNPTPTPRQTTTPTPTPSSTISPTHTPFTTHTPTPTPTYIPTVTPTPSPSNSSTPTPTPYQTVTPTLSPTPTVTPTPTYSPVPTLSPTPTPYQTNTPTPTPIPTSAPAQSPTPTPAPSTSSTGSPQASSGQATPTPTPSLALPTALRDGYVQAQTSAVLYGQVSSIGGAPVTRFGFQYGPTASYGYDVHVNGTYYSPAYYNQATAVTLNCGSTYHYRAYATNSGGTGYSSDGTFPTLACSSPAPTASGSPAAYYGNFDMTASIIRAISGFVRIF